MGSPDNAQAAWEADEARRLTTLINGSRTPFELLAIEGMNGLWNAAEYTAPALVEPSVTALEQVVGREQLVEQAPYYYFNSRMTLDCTPIYAAWAADDTPDGDAMAAACQSHAATLDQILKKVEPEVDKQYKLLVRGVSLALYNRNETGHPAVPIPPHDRRAEEGQGPFDNDRLYLSIGSQLVRSTIRATRRGGTARADHFLYVGEAFMSYLYSHPENPMHSRLNPHRSRRKQTEDTISLWAELIVQEAQNVTDAGKAQLDESAEMLRSRATAGLNRMQAAEAQM